MTPKEYLTQYRTAMQRIDAITAHLAELRAVCEKITPNPESGGGSHPASDKLGAQVARLIDAEDAAADEIAALRKTLAEVESVIASVPDATYRTLLYRRYILGETWEQVAVSMHYSWRQIIRLHGTALLAAKDVIACHIPSVV